MAGISATEFDERRARLLDHLAGEGLTGWVLFDEKYIQYFTGFGFLATERPVAVAANVAGELLVFVPEFEVERVRAETDFERIESYPEYPGLVHPMRILARALRISASAPQSEPTGTATRASSATRDHRSAT